jgi:hypothetical protein
MFAIRIKRLALNARAAAVIDEEAYGDAAFAHHDGVGIREMPSVDINGEIACCKTGQRAVDAALKLVDRRARTDCFAHGEYQQFPNAQWCREGERRRAVGSDGVEIERHPDANHTTSFCATSRSRLPRGSTVQAMSHFGNVPAESLVDAVEKHVAKMDDADLASLLGAHVATMPPDAVRALVESIFDAFRERGESSEDAAEDAGTALDGIERGDLQAIAALIAYARRNTGVLKEAMGLFAQEHRDVISALPSALLDGIAQRLTQTT